MSPKIDTIDTEDFETIPEQWPLLKPGLSGRLWALVISQRKHVRNLSVLVFANFLIAGLVASHYIIFARMEKVYFTSVIAGGILSVLLCLFLIPKLGGMGAAISLLIAHGISLGLYWVAMILHVRS